jgi:CBS domain-containing protein
LLVSQILKDKGDLVFTASPNETVGAAAALLHTRRVGAMVVLEEDETIAGILSERDIVRVIAEGGAAALSKPISTSMTKDHLDRRPGEVQDQRDPGRGRRAEGLYRGRLIGRRGAVRTGPPRGPGSHSI